jgi:xanthine dehydrogenase small subunit
MTAADVPTCRNTIRFILDGEVVEITDVDPNRTVLQYLREDLDRTGTKEGCAEGDCGACTVVVVDTDASGERLSARAVNSCIQFLPTLDGKELLTVESLGDCERGLHPAQKAMVDCHGSQCGFCTPGFVMSLFALYKSNAKPTRRDIDDALAGNLCRCTGYTPIVDAALAMYADESGTESWLTRSANVAGGDEKQRVAKLKEVATEQPLCAEGHGRRFFSPRTTDHLAMLISEYPSATILAGGTDVGLWVTKQQRSLDVVIYTGNVSGLDVLIAKDGYLNIGAAVSLTDAMSLIVGHYPTLEEMFVRFASPPIRNAGTLGGNIVNGSPIGDSMPALMVLDTELVLNAAGEKRTVALEDFYTGYQETDLKPGEFLERIRIPLPADGNRIQCYKVSKRFDQDISAVCGAYRLRLDGDKVEEISIAYGGMAAIPARATQCEQSLLGVDWGTESIARAMAALDKDFTPISDMRSSAWYRQQVCKNLLQRFFLECGTDAGPRVYSFGR